MPASTLIRHLVRSLHLQFAKLAEERLGRPDPHPHEDELSTMKRSYRAVVLMPLVLATLVAVMPEGQRVMAADRRPSDRCSSGGAETFITFPAGNSPEGIAIDRNAMYVSNRRPTDEGVISEILKINRKGKITTFATFDPPGTNPDAYNILGLTIGRGGDVFAAVDTRDPATHGVWRIGRKKKVRLAGSEAITFPNALTFDAQGNLYVTESLFFTEAGEPSGAVWRFTADGTGEPWLEDALLGPVDLGDLLIPPIGANGIAFYPPNHLYIANTQGGWIAHVPINPDGSPGDLEVVAEGVFLLTIDGIAMDVHGQIHGVVPGFAGLTALAPLLGLPVPPDGLPPVVMIDPASGDVVRSSASEYDDLFDFPVSLTFDGKSVFVINGALGLSPVPIPEPGPGVVAVGVGVHGFPIR